MEYRVLGPLKVTDGDVSVNVGGPKQRAVLAMLIAHLGRPLTAEAIALAVYGPDVPESGKRRVQTYVSTLRSILGDVIVRDGSGWILDVARAEIDTTRLEDLYESARSLETAPAADVLREALALWKGRPYADVESHGVLEAEVTRLVELRASVQHALIAGELELGRDADLVGDIEALLAEHPYRERFRAQHMLALYRAGRQTEALRSYQQIRSILVDELGVEPTPELRDLELRILNQDDTLLLGAQSSAPQPSTPHPTVEEDQLEIRFATTEDGVGIAYWELGSGPPVILIQNMSFNHLEAEWNVPSIASFYRLLAERYRVIRLNARGSGMSEDPFSRFGTTPTGAQVGMTAYEMGLDVSAVAAQCGLERFTLVGTGTMGPVAIEYAADHPDQVTGMVLCDTAVAIETSHFAEAIRAQDLMAQLSAEVSSEIAFKLEWAPPQEVVALAELVALANRRDRGAPERSAAITKAVLGWDATSRLADIVAPAIVLCGRGTDNQDPLPHARRLATGIPGARLRMTEGPFPPFFADQAAFLDAVDALHR